MLGVHHMIGLEIPNNSIISLASLADKDSKLQHLARPSNLQGVAADARELRKGWSCTASLGRNPTLSHYLPSTAQSL